MMPPDSCEDDGELPQFNVSYKPQKISPKFDGTVRQLLHKKIRDAYLHPQVKYGRGVYCYLLGWVVAPVADPDCATPPASSQRRQLTYSIHHDAPPSLSLTS
jgi:hypothetical protein